MHVIVLQQEMLLCTDMHADSYWRDTQYFVIQSMAIFLQD